MAVDYYVDDNETIYVSQTNNFSNVSPASWTANNYTHISLQDLTALADLSGQSTVFVNKVVFKFQLQGNFGTGSPLTYGSGDFIAGIVPYDLLGTDEFFTLASFQDVKGWPIKGSRGYYFVSPLDNMGASQDGLSDQWFRFQLTYKPRKALLINRNQAIVFSWKGYSGVSVTGNTNISATLKRGD